MAITGIFAFLLNPCTTCYLVHMSVRRFDRAQVGKAVRLDNGWIKAPARITRAGVFVYQKSDGSKVRELRLPEEVFAEDAVNSFALVPLTDDHPGELTAANTRALQVGSVGELKRDGNFLSGQVMVTDAAAVEKVLAGKVELSGGYFCELEKAEPGARFDGQEYDFIQRKIRGNHVAIVAKGRAGPEVRIQLDSADAVLVEDEVTEMPVEETKPTLTVETVGDVKPDPVLQARADAAEVKADAEAKRADAEQARADAAEVKIKELEGKLALAIEPAAVQAMVAERVALEAQAREFVGDMKLDGLDNLAVRGAVVKTLAPELSLEGKGAEYVGALFDSLTLMAKKQNKVSQAGAKATQNEKTTPAVSHGTPFEKLTADFFGRK